MYQITQGQFDKIEAARDSQSAHPFSDMYGVIRDILVHPDYVGRTADVNVVAWFGAAFSANLGTGGAADFIRQYTKVQIEIRSGNEIDVNGSQMQAISDSIAIAVYQTIKDSKTVVDGVAVYTIPTAHQIGSDDALATVSGLASINLPSEPGIWSGNPLYLGLGDSSFWMENIIPDPGNTYELFAASQSLQSAFGTTVFSPLSNFVDLAALFFGQGVDGFANAVAATNSGFSAAGDFLVSAYGRDFGGITLGPETVPP